MALASFGWSILPSSWGGGHGPSDRLESQSGFAAGSVEQQVERVPDAFGNTSEAGKLGVYYPQLGVT